MEYRNQVVNFQGESYNVRRVKKSYFHVRDMCHLLQITNNDLIGGARVRDQFSDLGFVRYWGEYLYMSVPGMRYLLKNVWTGRTKKAQRLIEFLEMYDDGQLNTSQP